MAGNATDTRIVQMQFDNRQFERDIARSEKSLDRFKEALDFSKCEDSLEDFEKSTRNLTFDSMAENLQKLTDKFTGLGTVSEYILSQVRHGLETCAQKAKNFFDSMTIEQINAGFEKYGQLNKNVQSIMAATGKSEEDVYTTLERLNQYTDQTSYNFTDMAANIGKFTSVGVPLDKAEKQMEGIANWAARSGGGIQEASRAMYNLSQAMGVGAMTKIDWKSIENAGMATKEYKEQLIQAGVETGTLVATVDKNGKTIYKTSKNLGKQVEVNYQNVAETLSKKWANTEVMQKSFMAYYYDDLYYEAKDTAIAVTDDQKKILEDAFKDDAVLSKKDWKTLESQQLATEGVKKAAIEAAIEQGNLVEETTKDGKKIIRTSEKLGKKMEVTLDNFEESLATGWLTKGIGKNVWAFDTLAKAAYESAQKCTTFTDVLNAWKDQLSTGWMQSYQIIFGNLSQSMELFSNICNKVGDALSNLIEFRNLILRSWADAGGYDSLWAMIVGQVTDSETGEALAYENAYGLLDVFFSIGKLLKDGFKSMVKIFMTGDEKLLMEEEDGYLGFWLGAKIKNVIDNVKNFVQSVHDFFNQKPANGQKTRWEQIQDVVNAVFATAVLGWTVIRDISGFISGVIEQLQPSIDAFLAILSALGIGIYNAADTAEEGGGLKKLFDELLVTIKPLTESINGLVQTVADMIIKFIETGQKNGTFAKLWDTIILVINTLGKVVAKVGAPVLDFVGSLMEVLGDLFSGDLTGEKLKQIGAKIEDAITKLFDDIFGLIPGFGDKIQEFLAYLFGFTEDSLDEESRKDSKTILGVIRIWVRKIFGGLKTLFEGLRGDAEQFNLFSWIKNLLGIGNLGQFLGGLGRTFQSMNLYGLLMMFGKLFLVFKLIQAIGKGGGLLSSVKGFFTGMSKTLKEGLKLKIDQDTETVGDKILKIAKALALMVAAVAVLGSMQLSSLAKGIAALGVVMLALYAFLWMMKKYIVNDFKEAVGMVGTIAAIGAAIVGISIGLALLILALKPLAKMDITQIGNMLLGLMGIVTIIGLFLTYVDKSVKIKGTGSLGLLALGIGLLIFALKPLATMSLTEMGKMALGLSGLLVILGLFSKAIGSIKIKGGTSIAFLAAGIGLLLLSLMQLKDLSIGEMKKMAAGLIGILAILGIFSKAVGSMKGKGMMQMVMLAGSIWILMQALLPLANLNWKQLGKLGAGLGAITIAFMFLINETQSMKGTGMLNMVAIAGAVWVLVQALLPLANVGWDSLAKMGAGLVVLSGIIIGLTKLTGDLNILQGLGLGAMFLGLSVVLLAFGFAMRSLKNIGWQEIATACIGLIAVIGAFALIQKTLLKDTDILSAVTTFTLMIGLAAVMFIFSIALNEIKNIKTDKILAFSVGLGILMAAIGLALNLTKGLSIGAAVKGILIISAAMAAVMLVLSLMAPILIGRIGTSLQQMSAQLKLTGTMFSDFITSMGGFSTGEVDETRAKFEAIYNLLAGLKDVSSFLKPVQDFSQCMLLLGSGLSQFQYSTRDVKNPEGSGAILLLEKLMSMKDQLTSFSGGENAATEIAYLGAGLNVFNTEVAGIGNGRDVPALAMLESILGLSGRLGELSGAGAVASPLVRLGAGLGIFNNAVSGISGGEDIPALKMLSAALDLSGRFDELDGAVMASTRLAFFGAGLATFHNATSGITDANPEALQLLTGMADNADALTKLTSLDLTGFSDQMAALGGALSIYALGVKSTEGLDVGKLPDVSGAIAILSSLSQGLADDVGDFKIPTLPPESDLRGFGVQLAALAGGLIEFANASEGLGSNTQKALDVLAFMKDLKKDLTEDAIAVTKVFNDAGVHALTLTSFGIDIAALGSSMKTYSESVADFKNNVRALDAINYFYNLQHRMNHDTMDMALFTKFTGQGLTVTTFEEFGLQVAALGSAMQTYSDAVANFSNNTQALEAIDYFYTLQERLTKTEMKKELFSWFTGANVTPMSMLVFGLQVSALGNAMKTYSESVTGFRNNQAALDAIDFFFELQERLAAKTFDNAIFSFFTGATPESLAAFGTDISALGDALGKFAASIMLDDGTVADFGNAMDALDILTRISNDLPKMGGVVQIWEGSNETLGQLSTEVTQLGAGLSALSDSLSTVGANSGKTYDPVIVKNALEAVETIADIAMRFDESMAGSGGYLQSGYLAVKQFNEIINSMNDNTGYYDDLGFIDNFVSFMKAFEDASEAHGGFKDTSIFDSFANMARGIHEMASVSADFNYQPLGLNMVEGLKAGILEGKAGVIDAMVTVALEAYEAAKTALGINSPSLAFMELGGYVTEGLAIGISGGKGLVSDAGEDVANSALLSTKQILNNLGLLLDGEFDDSPVIRPVLDLTDVTSGAHTIDGLLQGGSYSASLDTGSVQIRAGEAIGASGAYPNDYEWTQLGDTIKTAMDTAGAEMIARLSEQSMAIAEQVRNLKIYLDTGVLVGGVSPGVDRDIGRNAFYERRNN